MRCSTGGHQSRESDVGEPLETQPLRLATTGYPRTMSSDEPHAFGSSDPFSLGVEEELFLVDPHTGTQIDASALIIAGKPDAIT